MAGSTGSRVTLPEAPAPIGRYARGICRQGIGCLSGQFPLVDGVITLPGRLGDDLTVAQGQASARLAALNALAQMDVVLGGLGALEGLLRLDGILACSAEFDAHASVLDAASDVFLDYLGDRGRHARAIIPVHRLPRDAPIELVVTFATRRDDASTGSPGQ